MRDLQDALKETQRHLQKAREALERNVDWAVIIEEERQQDDSRWERPRLEVPRLPERPSEEAEPTSDRGVVILPL